ncbi:phage head spike fiber domain-containing protein [Aeromonas hydrophila]
MAVNDKDPTEAILLVEQTIGTFNQIVVGQEGQMVPVPGHPDQPTLAERVKQNLKPSTDAAAGFAAQASASAKAADDAVKLASQISGLETVANAIGMAALPLPDVWAPLSDSLRLITGYGRDVLVGSDVVARMVNFSRNSTATYIGKDGQLKTAAANEPRFEREGLLIEGQSQNVVKVSSNRVWGNGFSSGATLTLVNSTDPMTSVVCPKILRVGAEARYGIYLPSEISSPVTVGTVYTLTMRMRRLDAELGAISMNGASAVKNSANSPAGIWTTRTITFTADVTAVWPMTPQGEYEYAYIQLEALPFASSYIPTSGAAATRAADEVWLPNAGNTNVALGVYTIATNFDALASDEFARVIDLDNSGGSDRQYIGIDNPTSRKLVSRVGSTFTAGIPQNGGRCGMVANGGYFKSFCGNTFSGPISLETKSISARNRLTFFNTAEFNWGKTYGHIRNLRIWHRALADDQTDIPHLI